MTPEELSKLSPEEKNQRIAEICGTADRWVIIKRGLYYRPDAHGYTNNISKAWIVSHEEAKKHEYSYDTPVVIQPAPRIDYGSDLNAMHEAENHRWTGDLNKLFNDASLYKEWNYYEQLLHKNINSSASKRADAFLLAVC